MRPFQLLGFGVGLGLGLGLGRGFYAQAASAEAEARVSEILSKMQGDALAFRNEVERAHAGRCSAETLSACYMGSSSDCSSVFPGQVCMEPGEAVIAACAGSGDGSGDGACNALWDKTSTVVKIPSALASGRWGAPSDPEAIETVCYTRDLEPYLVEKYGEDELYWGRYGARPAWSYFGAHNGVFRQAPANHAEQCGLYDPRKRPWFVAASSGPKDVVLVIDTSGSMSEYGRIGLARDAAKTVVETLTVADRVAVVAFNGAAELLNIGGGVEGGLVRATQSNKDALVREIDRLEANGATNFHAAFDLTFASLERTIRQESSSGCNVAVLFLTDGEITEGQGPAEVIGLVNLQRERIRQAYGRTTYVFTYSLGFDADVDVPKRIACETGGLWAQVDDAVFGGDLIAAMAGYYKLFALGLGEGGNADFTAIVEPYQDFSTGKMATTVSAPVYDRTVSPPTLLGVVGIDTYMDALETVLGEDASSSSMLNRFVALSTARCPNLELTGCEVDALRFLGGGERAMCGSCGDGGESIANIVPQKCATASDLPRSLWANVDNEDKSYEERACCQLGGTEASDSCPVVGRNGVGAVLGGVFGGIVALICACLCCCTGKDGDNGEPMNQSNNNIGGAGAGAGAGAGSAGAYPVAQGTIVAQGTPVAQGTIVQGSGTAYDGMKIASAPPMSDVPGLVQN